MSRHLESSRFLLERIPREAKGRYSKYMHTVLSVSEEFHLSSTSLVDTHKSCIWWEQAAGVALTRKFCRHKSDTRNSIFAIGILFLAIVTSVPINIISWVSPLCSPRLLSKDNFACRVNRSSRLRNRHAMRDEGRDLRYLVSFHANRPVYPCAHLARRRRPSPRRSARLSDLGPSTPKCIDDRCAAAAARREARSLPAQGCGASIAIVNLPGDPAGDLQRVGVLARCLNARESYARVTDFADSSPLLFS